MVRIIRNFFECESLNGPSHLHHLYPSHSLFPRLFLCNKPELYMYCDFNPKFTLKREIDSVVFELRYDYSLRSSVITELTVVFLWFSVLGAPIDCKVA